MEPITATTFLDDVDVDELQLGAAGLPSDVALPPAAKIATSSLGAKIVFLATGVWWGVGIQVQFHQLLSHHAAHQLRYATPHTSYATPRRATSHRATPRHATPHPAAPHPYRTAPHRTAPHRTAPHRTAPHRTPPHRTAPHRTAAHPTAPHPTTPYTPTHRTTG